MKKQNRHTLSIIQTLRFMWPTIRRYDSRILWISVALIFLGIAVPYTELILPKLAVSLLLEGAAAGKILKQLLLFLLVAASLHFFYEYGISKRTWLLSYIGQGSSHDLLIKSITCSYSYSQDAQAQALYGRLHQLLESNATNCYILALYALTDMATGAAGFLIYLGILGFVKPWLMLLLAVTSAVHFVAMHQVSLHGHRLKKQAEEVDKRLEYLFRVTSSRSYAKDARLYQGSQWILKKLEGVVRERGVYDKKREDGRFLGHAACDLAAFLRDAIAYIVLLYMVFQRELSLDNFVLAVGAVRGLSGFLLKLVDGVVLFNSSGIYMDDFQKYGDGEAQTGAGAADSGVSGRPGSGATGLGAPERPVAGATDSDASPAMRSPVIAPEGGVSIEFQDVSYAYPGGKQIFDHFSLRIEPGEKIALVGLNGAGKTTLVNLMCGLFRPDAGRVLLNGCDIRNFTQEQLLAFFSPVFQDNFLMPTTLGENVAPCTPEDKDRIWHCLELAGLAAEAKGWPQGLDTPMTRVAYEEGLELSGGQKQKLYLARMLYRNAPVALLDEPTSALDPLAESEVYQQYAQFVEGRTSVFISHRLASTRFCSRILLLENGTVTEEGTHEELMRKRGAYYELFSVQSRYYKKQELHMAEVE